MNTQLIDSTRLTTGIANLDALLHGGLPKGSVTVLGGPPGSGKTVLAQQICFHNATAQKPVLYFNTLSEPTAKTLRYLEPFSFFEPLKIDQGAVRYVDLGVILRGQGLDQACQLIMNQVKQHQPSIVVIDSFRVFDDLANSQEQLRKFGYELAVNLMAWEVTTFLLGEYSAQDLETNPLFSIIDGLVLMHQREEAGEPRRFLRAVKLRGTNHSREECPFEITPRGLELYAPRFTLKRKNRPAPEGRCITGITRFDELLGDGIPRGSSILVAGVAGTGKTALLLEFLYRGAERGEKGIIFSFEETEERLRANALGLGMDIDREIARGMIQIVFIGQPDIRIEENLRMIQQRVTEGQAQRVVIDSVSVFLHRLTDPQVDREKVFQLSSLMQNTGAVGLFATDIPYGEKQLSRFGVEETVVDGVVLLSAVEEGMDRQRYVEIYKLRNTAHLKGRHEMEIGPGGITVFPRHGSGTKVEPPPLQSSRLGTGVPGLDALCGGGLLAQSCTLISGSAGIGKTTLGMQFLLEGAEKGEPGLYFALEEGTAQILETARGLNLPLAEAVEAGAIQVVHLDGHSIRANQLPTLLDDRLRDGKIRRLVIDSVSHVARDDDAPRDLRRLLYSLVLRFKARGVTSLLTLEADSLYEADSVTERGYSPVADNIWLLRYARTPGEFRPTLSVVKTRGSSHDWGTWYYSIGSGGVHVRERVDGFSRSHA